MTDPFRPDDPDRTQRVDVPAEPPVDQPSQVEPSGGDGTDASSAATAAPATPEPTTPGGAPWAATDPWATPAVEPLAAGVDRYSPAPEPRPVWSRHDEPMMAPTPERWYEPAPIVGTPAAAPAASGGSRGTGTILAAALLSAVLASGGTVLALDASGALDRPVPVQTSATGQTVGSAQPVTIDESSATIDVAAKVNPAVVKITTSGDVNTNVGIIPETGVGSGVIYDTRGWILTNHHVVQGSDKMQVELSDGRSFTGTVYGIDTLTDLAIVKIDGTDLPTAALGSSDALKVGQLVIAIGSPLGTYSNSVTSGIVSAKGRSIVTDNGDDLNNLIQTDAAINPGNSGGPLLDANGNVVGINTAIAADSNGIGFAIPIDIARPIMEQAVAGQKLARPYMGVTYTTITRKLAAAQKLPVNEGALINGDTGQAAVQPNTPAAKAGLKDGDIIVKVNDTVIDGAHPLDATLSQFAPGDTVTVEILRDGATTSVQLTLGTRPAS